MVAVSTETKSASSYKERVLASSSAFISFIKKLNSIGIDCRDATILPQRVGVNVLILRFSFFMASLARKPITLSLLTILKRYTKSEMAS